MPGESLQRDLTELLEYWGEDNRCHLSGSDLARYLTMHLQILAKGFRLGREWEARNIFYLKGLGPMIPKADPPATQVAPPNSEHPDWPVKIAGRCRQCSTTLWTYADPHCGSCGSTDIEPDAAETPRSPSWQPIATAPKGTWLDGPNRVDDPVYTEPPDVWLLLEDGRQCLGAADAYYAERGGGFDGGSYWVESFSAERVTPTHWMPLPATPESSLRAQEPPR